VSVAGHLRHLQEALQRSLLIYQWNFGNGELSLLRACVYMLHVFTGIQGLTRVF
jgi:hypothetical protein